MLSEYSATTGTLTNLIHGNASIIPYDFYGRKCFASYAPTNGSTTTMLSFGCALVTSNTPAVADDSAGAWRKLTSSSSTERFFAIIIGNLEWLPEITIRLKTDTTIPSDQLLGIWDGNGSSYYTCDNSDVMAIRYSVAAGDSGSTWRIVYNNSSNTTATVINTGLTISTDTAYTFKFVWVTTTLINVYYLSNKQWILLSSISNSSSLLPDSTISSTFYFDLHETGVSSRIIKLGYITGSSNG